MYTQMSQKTQCCIINLLAYCSIYKLFIYSQSEKLNRLLLIHNEVDMYGLTGGYIGISLLKLEISLIVLGV